ncbi:serine/arginine repetitive matrix protein 2-like [Gorilla gorilla gorilla]|uniref:serine/arginine repetitive matrix protein 2-like n=1 Tax=Gorilla gorilla gorilla TaxID=9595 RepID=UPI003008A5D1
MRLGVLRWGGSRGPPLPDRAFGGRDPRGFLALRSPLTAARGRASRAQRRGRGRMRSLAFTGFTRETRPLQLPSQQGRDVLRASVCSPGPGTFGALSRPTSGFQPRSRRSSRLDPGPGCTRPPCRCPSAGARGRRASRTPGTHGPGRGLGSRSSVRVRQVAAALRAFRTPLAVCTRRYSASALISSRGVPLRADSQGAQPPGRSRRQRGEDGGAARTAARRGRRRGEDGGAARTAARRGRRRGEDGGAARTAARRGRRRGEDGGAARTAARRGRRRGEDGGAARTAARRGRRRGEDGGAARTAADRGSPAPWPGFPKMMLNPATVLISRKAIAVVQKDKG